MKVASFVYLRANPDGRSQIMISIGRERIGGTSDGEGIWPFGLVHIKRSWIRSEDINTTYPEKASFVTPLRPEYTTLLGHRGPM